MNTRLSLVGLIGLALLGGCDKFSKPKAQDNEQEIEQRVQARLAEEHRVQQEQQLKEREQQLADREKQIADRDAAATATPAPAPIAESVPQQDVAANDEEPAVTPQTFYDDLDPQGDWIETPDYGYVFRPRIAATDDSWRPYSDGRWVDTDDGWTWVSNEPFGWACYHYGRWTRLHGAGWVWVPGTEWAPAWVSWRYSDDYCGWAPLPPEAGFNGGESIGFDVAGGYGDDAYVFVPTASLCEESLRPFIVDRSRNVTIINNTVNITNIVRKRVANRNVIINQGPRIASVQAASRKPVPKYTIARRPASAVGGLQLRGNSLQISAPVAVRAAGRPQPRRIAQRLQKAEVERGTPVAAQQAQPLPQPQIQRPQQQQRVIEQQQQQQRAMEEQQQRQRQIEAQRQRQELMQQQQMQAREQQQRQQQQEQPAVEEQQQRQRQIEAQQQRQELMRQQMEARQQQAERAREAAAARQDAAQRAQQQEPSRQQTRQGGGERGQQPGDTSDDDKKKKRDQQ